MACILTFLKVSPMRRNGNCRNPALPAERSVLQFEWLCDRYGIILLRTSLTRLSSSVRLYVESAGHHVTAHRKNTRCQRPHMKIVNGADSVDTSKLFSQTDDIDMSRRAFQQNIDSVANQNP